MKENFVKNFIDKLIEPYDVSDVAGPQTAFDIESVYQAIISSKFRKTSVDEETSQDIRNKVKQCYYNKKPLQFSVPFGAYKAWRLNLNFRPDWAEVFNIAFILRYAASIAKFYPYGVDITYTYLDGLMYFVSDFPRDKARQYVKDFRKLLSIFNNVHPSVKFNIKKINDLYGSTEECYIDFLKQFLYNLVFWNDKYDEYTKNRHLNSARRNVNLYGERHIGDAPLDIQEKYFYYSALMTDAVDCMQERRKYNKNQDRIQIIGVRGPNKSINLGACETSTVHFWTGRGCLKSHKGEIKPYIYTYSNLSKILESGNFIELEVESIFTSISDNFKKILFVKEETSNEKN